MFTLVITIVVVVGSIAAVLATAGVLPDQSATARTLRPSPSDGVSAVAVAPGSPMAVTTVTATLPAVVESDTRPRRLRSAVALVALTAFLGAVLAGGISVGLVLVSLALQRAAG